MADVNWALGIMPNAGEAFTQAFQQGQQTARQNRARAALAALAKDPNNTGALSALAESDPETAMQFRKQQLEYSKAQLAQHQDSILKGAQIVRELKPTDQASWDRARALAAQAGVDISQVPAQFDPQYAQGVVHLADALDPKGRSEGFTLSPGQVRYGPNGQVIANGPPDKPRYYSVPPGGMLVPEPGSVGAQVGPQPGAIEDGYRFKGGNPADPNSWEPVGGPTPSASGGFSPNGY